MLTIDGNCIALFVQGSSGDVGIGTNSPDVQLQLTGNSKSDETLNTIRFDNIAYKITEYELLHIPMGISIRLKLRYSADGHSGVFEKRAITRERWSINRGESALCKIPNQHGFFEFHYEPLPSSRDETYYEQYRFDSDNEAVGFWEYNRHRILTTND